MTASSTTDPDRTDATLEALTDPACREILRALDEPKTASALADACSVSSSTLYRKLDDLVAAELAEERIVLEPDYTHSTRYAATFEEITLSIDGRRRLSFRVGE